MVWHFQAEGAAQGWDLQQRTQGKCELSLKFFFFCKFNRRDKNLALLVLLQSPRLLEPAVVHDGWSGEAVGLHQNQS
jgi:hypothetical protein